MQRRLDGKHKVSRAGRIRKSGLARAVFSSSALFVSTLLLAAVIWHVDPSTIGIALLGIPAWSLATAAVLLFASAALAGPRLQVVAAQLGHHLRLVEAMQAMALGQIGGALSVQFFGQIAVRTALLRRQGVQLPANIAIASVEKFAAFGVSLTLAFGGVLWLFGKVAFQLEQGGAQFLFLALGTAFATAGGAVFGWGRLGLCEGRKLARIEFIKPLLVTIAFTIAMQIGTAGAYVVATKALAPTVALPDLVAAAFVIMFAASIPISFAGWGVRELTAVFVLTSAGIPAGTAVAVAISIGILSLLAVAAIAALTMVMPKSAPARLVGTPTTQAIDIGAALAWLVPLIVATLVVMQVKAPTTTGLLNVNPADPFAILGAALLIHAVQRGGWPVWQLSYLGAHVIAMTSALIVSFAIGLAAFGPTDWAVFNRALGWFVLLAYAATGAIIVCRAGRLGGEAMLRSFVGGLIGIVVLNVLMLACLRSGITMPAGISILPFEGLSGNRNAFAFLIVMAIASLPFIGVHPLVLGVLGAGVWYTGSFAGFGAATVVVLLGLVRGSIALSTALKALATGAAIVFALAHTGPLMILLGRTPGPGADLSVFLYSSGSLAERWKSLSGGLALFTEHPIWGAGLGAYMNAQTNIGDPLVIHSTPLWILAEMGVVGFVAFAWFGWRLIQHLWRSRTPEAAALLLATAGFCTMAAVHDMMYQRSIWLIAGTLLAVSAKPAVETPP